MNFLEENLRVLQKFHPEVAEKLSAVIRPPEQAVWVASRKGPLTVRRGGIFLASSFDPVTEATHAVPDWGSKVDFAILTGLGAGYLVEAVVARHPDLPVVVAESDPAWLLEVLSHRDLTALLAHRFLVFCLGPDPRELGRILDLFSCRTIEILSWRPLTNLEPGWHKALEDQVAQAQARAGVNPATYAKFGALWLRNLRKNEAFSREVRPLASLAGLWAGCPAVIAAAGPSLGQSFEWMKRHRKQFVLIAVDTAWSALSAHGFEPDVLVVLDGQYWNARHVDRTPPENTLVVTEWTGPPRAFRLAPGRTYVARSSIPFLRRREETLWGTLGALASGGSVATAAWSLALLLGCREVAFAGLDLGYPRGQTHVPGSQFEEATHRQARRFAPAETLGLGLRGFFGLFQRPSLDGGTILSDARMDLFRDWLSASVLSRPDIRAVNFSTIGSVVPGLLVPPLDYGSSWPSILPRAPQSIPALLRSDATPESPPFDALRTLSAQAACSQAQKFWGPEVWDRWSSRALATLDRFPSPRSRRALEEVITLALSWEPFWNTDAKSNQFSSRNKTTGRE